jgi:uncharacterized protein
MDHRPSAELLADSHEFPGVFQIKAIGSAESDFPARVIEAVTAEVGTAASLNHSLRTTPDGRHVSVTLNVHVENPEQVRSIYARIQALDGLRMLL